jgi:hypothetical protein
MKLTSHVLTFVLLAPCFSCQEVPTPTKEQAIERGEKVFADYLKEEPGQHRNDYEEPEVMFAKDGVMLTFHRRGTTAGDMFVILGRNGCVSLSGGTR